MIQAVLTRVSSGGNLKNVRVQRSWAFVFPFIPVRRIRRKVKQQISPINRKSRSRKKLCYFIQIKLRRLRDNANRRKRRILYFLPIPHNSRNRSSNLQNRSNQIAVGIRENMTFYNALVCIRKISLSSIDQSAGFICRGQLLYRVSLFQKLQRKPPNHILIIHTNHWMLALMQKIHDQIGRAILEGKALCLSGINSQILKINLRDSMSIFVYTDTINSLIERVSIQSSRSSCHENDGSSACANFIRNLQCIGDRYLPII